MRTALSYCALVLLLIMATMATDAQPLPDSITKKIDNLFTFWNKNTSPGMAIGIVRNDSLIYAKGYGMANLEYSVPIKPETIFHMASVSKQFTAYSIVLLAQQGKLQLDDDIHKYLTWFPDLKEKITIRHLLNHTSGIRDQWQLLAIAGTRIDDVITQEQIVKVLSKQQALNAKPGAQYNYSNSGFTMLAEIVKSVSGQTLRKFTDSAIFKPLGMGLTHFHDDYTEIEKNRAYSYSREKMFSFSNSILSYSNAGATSLFTNINDLSKWVMNFYKPVAGNPASIEQLVQKGKLNNGAELNYALGISSGKYKGWKEYSHSGGDAGFRTYLTVLPDLKMGFMVFSNLGDVNVYEKAYKLVDLFVADTAAAKTATAEIIIDSSRAIVKEEARVQQFAGNYIAEDGAQFNFVLRNHAMYWERFGRSDLMYTRLNDSFIVAKSPEVSFVFSAANKKIRVDEYWPDGGYRRLVKYSTDSMADKERQQYSGEYYCPELDCRYTIIVKDNALVLTSNKYNDSKLKPAGPDHFFTDYWWMKHLQVIRNGKKIIGFEVNDGRIMHLRFNRLRG